MSGGPHGAQGGQVRSETPGENPQVIGGDMEWGHDTETTHGLYEITRQETRITGKHDTDPRRVGAERSGSRRCVTTETTQKKERRETGPHRVGVERPGSP